MENLGGVGVVEGTAIADTGAADGAADGAGTGGADTGTGAGDGAGTEGQGDGAGDGDGAAGDGDAGAGDGEGSGEEGELGDVGDEGAEDDSDVADADGRKVDAKTRQDLAALKKVNPESAKRLSDMYHRSRSLMEEVGAKTLSEAVHKVRQINATLEGVGGADGLTELQDEVGDYRNEIQQFSEGDPALLTQLYEANADSFGTAIRNGLDMLSEKNAKLYDQVIVGSIVSRLESGGIYGALDEVVKFVQDGEGQKAYDRLGDIKKWMNLAKSLADGQNSKRKEHDPRTDEINRRAQELDTRERQQFEGGVAEDVNRMNNRASFKLVDPLMRELKIPLGGKREFVNALNSRIYTQMKSDKAFQRAAKSLMDKGDRERASKFTHAKYAELLPNTFRTLRNEMYPSYKPRVASRPAAGNGTGKGTPAAKGASGNGAAKVVPGKVYPKSAVDVVATPDIYLVVGKAYLRGTQQLVPYERG
jgi:hypothetical protein